MKPWAAEGRLPRCDKCDKEFEKLLRCGRCGNAFYCSRECQNSAWKTHKFVCAKPGEAKKVELEAAAALVPPAPRPDPAPAPRKPPPGPVREGPGAIEEDEDREAQAESRRQLLREARGVNAQMVQAMQESHGDPVVYLPRVLELKDELERLALDHVRAGRARAARAAARRQAAPEGSPEGAGAAQGAAEDPLLEAREASRHAMTEVISAILQKGLSTSACVDQLDIANNHYGSSMVWPRSPKDFALEEGDMDGFEPAVGKLRKNGFVCVEGLLDAEIAAAVHANCSEQFWARRGAGAMRPAGGAASAGHECWVPYPPRRGTPPELGHALRILFGLPREIERHGYPVRLKVPNMARLGCLAPGKGREGLHLDGAGAAGRELSLVLFLSPGWVKGDGGELRAYLKEDADSPGPRPSDADREGAEAGATADAEEPGPAPGGAPRAKGYEPEAGRCLIFRSGELWHEVLPARKRLYTLTLFVQRDS